VSPATPGAVANGVAGFLFFKILRINKLKKLSDILPDGQANAIQQLFNTSKVARETGPLPPGTFEAHIIAGEAVVGRTNATPGYKLTFQVIEPVKYAGRKFWLDCWFTPKAMPQSKRDLGKLGVTDFAQLENPLPVGIRCRVELGLQPDGNGNKQNRVWSFEVIAFDEPKPDASAPTDSPKYQEGASDVEF